MFGHSAALPANSKGRARRELCHRTQFTRIPQCRTPTGRRGLAPPPATAVDFAAQGKGSTTAGFAREPTMLERPRSRGENEDGKVAARQMISMAFGSLGNQAFQFSPL